MGHVRLENKKIVGAFDSSDIIVCIGNGIVFLLVLSRCDCCLWASAVCRYVGCVIVNQPID